MGTRILFLLLALSAAVLTGCGNPETEARHDRPFTSDVGTWNPEAVTLRCVAEFCPEGVGALVFAQNIPGGYRLQRCTGTLIDGGRVLTNSHCGKSLAYDRAFFFVATPDGRTLKLALGARLYDMEDGRGIEAGMGPDLATFALIGGTGGARARRIARKIPRDMGELAIFKINEPGRSLFQNFILEKDLCTTIPKQALFGGGAQENNVGLALFGCRIVRGNSGSPLFAAGNWDDIQVVVNSSYPFQNAGASPLLSRLESLFESRPSYLTENFAMGNRVHCMEIAGEAKPETVCARASLNAQLRRRFETSANKIYRERLDELNADGIALWTLRIFEIKVKKNSTDLNAVPGMVMIPVPLCMRAPEAGARGELPPAQVQYVSLTLDEDGAVAGRLRKSRTLTARFFKLPQAERYQISIDRDFRSDLLFDRPGLIVPDPDDGEARRLLAANSRLIGSCTEADFAKINADAENFAREFSLNTN